MSSTAHTDNRLYHYIQQHAPVVQDYIDRLALFGVQPESEGGGIIRPVYSPSWQAAQAQLDSWMIEAGLQTSRDAVGNLWGRMPGREAGPSIASGSHLDTVKKGGRYDGSLGIVAALSAIRFLKELYGPPARTLEVVALCEEEGSRFSNSFLGSRALIGALPEEELYHSRDSGGVSVAEAARACGFEPQNLAAARRRDIGAFIELHIEQGRILDDAGLEVGIVQAITGLQHLEVTFEGRADHAGTTPMDLRSDALVAAATAINRIQNFALEMGRPAVATIGQLEVEPGARNIVPARVVMSVDFRHSDPARKEQMARQIPEICREAGAAHHASVEVKRLMDKPPAPMSPEIVEVLAASARELSISQMPMVSGAGHDSQVLVESYPTAMIFVPSVSGRSHSAAEYTPIEQIVPGIAVLAQAMYKLAY